MLSEKEYRTIYKESVDDPQSYWAEKAANIDWFKKWDRVRDVTDPLITKWFCGGQLNVCYNCLDRHVAAGKADKVIIHHRSSLTKKDRNITYGYLLAQVSKLAAVLANCGVRKGDTVVIYMPNIPEGVIAMLACTRLGAIHTVLYGGLTPSDLAIRMEHSKAKLVISSVVGMFRNELLNYKERLDAAVLLCNLKPRQCIFFRGDQKSLQLKEGDLIWEEVIDKFGTHDCVPVESEHSLFYVYTSGTAGNPKAVVVESGPTCVRYISEVRIWNMNDKVVLASSELGWILGHAMFCYLPLLNDFETVVYEGDMTAGNDTMYKLIQDFKVNLYIGSYTTIRGIMYQDPKSLIGAKHDLSSMERMLIGAECPDTKSMEFAAKTFGASIMNMWGQTEANMGIAAFFSKEEMDDGKIMLYPKPSPGIHLVALKDNGTEAARGEIGKLAIKLPLLPGFATTLLKRHERFLEDYFKQFPGYYDTKDEGIIREDGTVAILGRSDDVINVGPYRVAGSNVEEVILQHPSVHECVVVGVPDKLKGDVPFALFVSSREGDISDAELIREINDLVLQKLGSSIFFRGSVCVPQLPKTLTGKIQRKPVRDILNGKTILESDSQYSLLTDILRIVKSSGTVPDIRSQD